MIVTLIKNCNCSIDCIYVYLQIEAKRDKTVKELAQTISSMQHNRDSNIISVNDIWNAACTKCAIYVSVTVILYFVLSRK